MKMARLNGVEIFAAGTHRGKKYTVQDLDEIVRNFERFSAEPASILTPPVVLGHEEDQRYLERSDMPAAGWVTRVWRKGDKLKANFSDVPKKIAKLINNKSYRKVSSEIYDDFEDQFGENHGYAIRRVALLGGEIPQVKGLADLPKAEYYGERIPDQPTFYIFSEVTGMDRSEMINALSGCGFDTAVLDGMSDDQLAEAHRVVNGIKDQNKLAEEMATDDDDQDEDLTEMGEDEEEQKGLEAHMMDEDEDDEDAEEYACDDDAEDYSDEDDEDDLDMYMDDDEETEEYADRDSLIQQVSDVSGLSPEELQGLSDEELEQLLAEAAPPPQGEQQMSDKATGAGSRKHPTKITVNFAEARQRVHAKRIARLEQRIRKREQSLRKEEISTFCESMLRKGKMLPCERDQAEAALRMADDKKVHKFGEESKTQFQILMDLFRSRPNLMHFGERMKQPEKKQSSEERVIEQHFNAYAETFKQTGQTKEKLLNAFRAERKRNERLTAKEFLGLSA